MEFSESRDQDASSFDDDPLRLQKMNDTCWFDMSLTFDSGIMPESCIWSQTK